MRLGIYCENGIDEKILNAIRDSSEMNLASCFSIKSKNINNELSPNLKYFSDYHQFVDYNNAIIFYDSVSYQEIEYAIKHLKHIFLHHLSKLSISELTNIKQLAEEANVQVFTQFNKDYYTKIFKIFSIIEQPKYIETNFNLNNIAANENNETILEMISEDLLSIISLNKSEVKKITTKTTSLDNKKTDVVNVYIEFYNQSIAQMTVSSISPENSHTLKIYDNNKLITVDLMNSKSWIITKKDSLNEQSLFSENIGNLVVNPIFACSESHSSIALKDFSEAFYQNNNRKSNLNLMINSLKLKNEIISKLNI